MTSVSRRGVLAGAIAAMAAPALGGAAHAHDPAAPIKIGVLLDHKSPHGQRQLLGVRHQRTLINLGLHPTCPRRVQLLELDASRDPVVTRSAVAKLIAIGVHALIGTSTPGTLPPLVDAAQQSGTPLVIPLIGAHPTEPFVFRSAPTPRQLLAAMTRATPQNTVGFLLQTQADAAAIDNAAAIKPCDDTAATLKQALTELIANPKVEAIAIMGFPQFSANAVIHAKALGHEHHLHASTEAVHPLFLNNAGSAAEGVRLPGSPLAAYRTLPATYPNWAEIVKFGSTFDPVGGVAGSDISTIADALGMLAAAFAETDDRAEARDHLESMDRADALSPLVVKDGAFHLETIDSQR